MTVATAPTPYRRLRALLDELFQFNRADLDFGIYRIMNQRRAEVARFLDEDLQPRAREAVGAYQAGERAALEARAREIRERAVQLRLEPEVVPDYQDVQAALARLGDPAALEGEIFSDLYQFFRRYYKDGDFLSLRRYKAGVYAIPYEGEEVKLHWANADQYYVKTSEAFQDYRFRLPDERHVHFRLVAAGSERDNNKAGEGRERRFVLRADDPAAEVGGELHVSFEYRPDAEKQAKRNAEAVATLLGLPALAGWRAALAAPAPTASNAGRTLLEKHLADYTARNSFDYFIHKDLGGFLRRELDFYLKNEILHLDDLDTADAARVAQSLARLRAIKQLGHTIIAFLAQLEDFQKKLFLKKKFVTGGGVCCSLLHVPESLWPAILSADAQWAEWDRLFAIGDLPGGVTRHAAFLRANPNLILDTRHFAPAFKYALLTSLDDLDARTNGLLINGDNFQALNLLAARYREQVKCIYIDPPYNTGNDGFMYKDNYRHSSWLSMMEDRLRLARELLTEDGAIFANVDDNEQANLKRLMDIVFGEGNLSGTVIWQKRYAPANDSIDLAYTHDYLLAYGNKTAQMIEDRQPILNRLPRDERTNAVYKNMDNDPRGLWRPDNYTSNKSSDERPNLYYSITHPHTGEQVWPSQSAVWRYTRERHEQNVTEGRVWWGRNGTAKVPAYKRFLSEVRDLVAPTIWGWQEVGHTDEAKKELMSLFPTQRRFETPKPTRLMERVVTLADSEQNDQLVMDFFAGSGTTGHAVINLNREDGGRRKYILVEMGEYFDTVLKPRILKASYSKDWKDGKPVSREGVPQLIKYLTLESYEDTLNNLTLRRTDAQQRLLDAEPAVREDYLLRYMLDFEARGSASLLDLKGLEDPFNYQLLVTQGGESRAVTVDLPETFSLLLGLRVARIALTDGFLTVEGLDPDDARVLVIWRTLRGADRRAADAALDAFFVARGYRDRPADAALDRVYVNGDNTLANLARAGDRWRVLLTEEAFQALMFAAA